MTNSIQKTPFCKSTVSKKSTGIIHKAKLHCTRPYHPILQWFQSNAVALSMWNPQAAGIIKQERWMQPCTGMMSPRQKATVNQDKANMNASTLQPFFAKSFTQFRCHGCIACCNCTSVLKHSSCRFDTSVMYHDLQHIVLAQEWTFCYFFASCRNKTGYAHILQVIV